MSWARSLGWCYNVEAGRTTIEKISDQLDNGLGRAEILGSELSQKGRAAMEGAEKIQHVGEGGGIFSGDQARVGANWEDKVGVRQGFTLRRFASGEAVEWVFARSLIPETEDTIIAEEVRKLPTRK